jgi:hypothetical protein
MYCRECGKQLDSAARFCKYCGKPQIMSNDYQENIGSPQQNWNNPPQNWNNPQQNWGNPQQNWNNPQQNWGNPQQNWGNYQQNSGRKGNVQQTILHHNFNNPKRGKGSIIFGIILFILGTGWLILFNRYWSISRKKRY